MGSNVNQPSTHNQFSQTDGSLSASVPQREPSQTDRSPQELASALKSTQQQLEAVSQQNQQLVQHNQQLQIEIERIMASALNLHHIVHAGPTAANTPAASSKPGSDNTSSDTPAPPSADRTATPDEQTTAVVLGHKTSGQLDAPQTSASPIGIDDATEYDADDMFAELDRLLADDLSPQPQQPLFQEDNSLQAALSHVDSRHRVNGSRPDQPKQLSPKLPTNLRRTVAAPPQPAASSDAIPRRSNLWLIVATVAVMLSCFGAGFLITLPLLQSSDR
ncbi:MAG: hypothetical protein WBA10_12415 [Elainellaceae cyanobacterium]